MPNNLITVYECAKCGAQYPKWQGRCSECGSWGTVNQETKKTINQESKITPDKPINLAELAAGDEIRIKTNIAELDRVLGGGIVRGSLVLLGGDPGVGKSTLALQLAQEVANTLYVSGEESAQQIKLRGERLKLDFGRLKFLPQTNAEKIIATITEARPALVIIDSIQTMNSDSANGAGTVSQITAVTAQLLGAAKETNIPIIIIGHVTKEGFVAGPKTLEHLVDTVLYLENDNKNHYKILRSVKNRFGSTGEIGIFEMTGGGLREVSDPTRIFFDSEGNVSSGSVATIVMEGQRPFLIEIQALVAKTAFGYPIRKTTGFDANRLQMLIAVIAKTARLNLANQDIYLNIAGGLKIKEPAVDLAVCLAIVSALLDLPIAKKTLVFGEVGLSGEVRAVPQAERRLKEAEKLKFEKIIAPRSGNANNPRVLAVKNISEAIQSINQKPN